MLASPPRRTFATRFLGEPLQEMGLAVRVIGPRGWAVAAAAGIASALLIGTVAAIFDNPFFTRMTPVRPQDYVIWTLSALLVGLIAGTYIKPASVSASGRAAGGGILSFLAVGCPICNKMVVLLLGTSGALTFFAPLQLYIGIASVSLLLWALRLRASSIVKACTYSSA